MRMHRHYTQEEINFVRRNIRGRPYAEMTRLFNERFGLRITLKQMGTLLYKHKICNGIGIYLPGHIPCNKGKKHPSWLGNYKPIGSEREEMGYLVVKVSSRKNAGNKNWKRKHVAIWEKANGKVPKGHIVIFADGDNRNFDLDNLLLITREELMVMNTLGLISPRKDLTVAGKVAADIAILIRKHKHGEKKRGRK